MGSKNQQTWLGRALTNWALKYIIIIDTQTILNSISCILAKTVRNLRMLQITVRNPLTAE